MINAFKVGFVNDFAILTIQTQYLDRNFCAYKMRYTDMREPDLADSTEDYNYEYYRRVHPPAFNIVRAVQTYYHLSIILTSADIPHNRSSYQNQLSQRESYRHPEQE